METLHQHEYPSLVILASLLEPLHSRHDLITVIDVITHHPSMCEFSLLWTEPARSAGCIREEDEAGKSYSKSYHTFEDEEPI